ncbi:hypothetical protein WMY93_018245 [Mugilogobius chulae]|uniref:DUF7041 domain-containing protein n=1 Tax=Mugilogobius chulae TaxID=88201 RepID=A0AAW0NIL0_9GOBI
MSAAKKVKTYSFHEEWELDFLFTSVNDKCVCLICGFSVAVGKRCNVERHFTKLHGNFPRDFPTGSALRREKVKELKLALQRQQSLFTKPTKRGNAATEASFKVAHLLTKHKKAFTDGAVVKEAMTAVAETLFEDHKSKTEILSAISSVQLGANTVARRVTALSRDAAKQLDTDIQRCKWFSVQCDESVDASDTAQLAVFVRMVFEDFSTKEEFLTLLPLKTTTRGIDIYNAVKNYLVEKNVPIERLVSITSDGAPAMTGRHSGFIAHCKADPDFPKFLNYHCIIHQQAICAKVLDFDHVMGPVVKIINSIRAKAKQHRSFKLFLEECDANHGDLLLHTDVRWLSREKSWKLNKAETKPFYSSLSTTFHIGDPDVGNMSVESSSAAAPPAAPAIYAATVKLPDFWQHDPEPWFHHVEAQFQLRGITADDTRYFHVVSALDSATTRRLMGLLREPPQANKYAELKKQLLQLYQLSDMERADRLLSLSGLGDSKPSELMENMLALLGSGDASFLFTHLFLRQLPVSVRTTLAASELVRKRDYRGLAEEADRLWLASRQYSSVHALLPGSESAVPGAVEVAAVTERRKKEHPLCFYHRRFGVKARRCIPPCSFQQPGNETAGAR